MESKPRVIIIYTEPNGRCWFKEWMQSLKDTRVKAAVFSRINKLELGNFGDSKSLGAGVHELREHLSPGYRIYFGLAGSEIVVLLCGGSKQTQRNDISKAKRLWRQYLKSG